MNKANANSLSPLLRQLSGQKESKSTPLDAFRLARKKFLAGQRVDMGPLADELSVSRVTLYRWVSSRDQLLTEVLWSLASQGLVEEGKRTRAKGGERIAVIAARYTSRVIKHAGMRAFLEREGEAAMRLVTSAAGGFQKRLITEIKRLLVQEVEQGLFTPPVPIDELAYAIVRLAESYVYRRFITGEEPDVRSVERLLKLLLR